MAVEYENAKQSMIDLVDELLAEELTLRDLSEYDIGVKMWTGDKKSKGKLVISETEILNQKNKVLTDYKWDAIVYFSGDWWQNMANPQQRRAEAHKALYRLLHTEAKGLSIRPYDIEEYNVTIERYGLNINPAIRRTAEYVQQRIAGGDKVQPTLFEAAKSDD